MDKAQSDFNFWAAGYLLMVAAVIVLTSPKFQIQEISVDVQIPQVLLCFDKQSEVLRTGDTNIGCFINEGSLGDSPLLPSQTRPTSINETFELRFLAAKAAAKAKGIEINITSGFRSQDLQARLFADAVRRYGSEEEAAKWVLPDDVSNHPWGLAIDINYPGDMLAVKWLEENGSLFGLCRVYENEWWHFEPVIAPGEECPPMLENALATLASSQDGEK
jgi:zinc D-Ala-D-Ala carboxypeptidase